MTLSDDNINDKNRKIKVLAVSDGGRSPVERILESLRSTHRRYLLYHLQDDGTSTLAEAARWVAARDLGCGPDEVPAELHERFKTDLYHTHLPKLTDLHIIDYDERTGAIRLRDPPDKLDAFLALTRDEDEPR